MKNSRRSKSLWNKILLFVGVFSAPISYGAAACCGGGALVPALISANEQSLVSLSLGQAQVVADADANGQVLARADSQSEARQTMSLSLATLLSDRWQIGATLPMVRRARQFTTGELSAFGTGDLVLDVAYELLTEWTYNPWKPNAFVYIAMGLPTGGDRFSTSLPGGLDSRGSGFFTPSIGLVLRKAWGVWDASFFGSLQHPIGRKIDGVDYTPTLGGAIEATAGWSPSKGPVRIGLSIARNTAGRVGNSNFPGAFDPAQSSWRLGLQASYHIAQDWSASLTFSDESLLSGSESTSLSRSFSAVVIKRWGR